MPDIRVTNLEDLVQRLALLIDQGVHLCLGPSTEELANITSWPKLFTLLLLEVAREHARARNSAQSLVRSHQKRSRNVPRFGCQKSTYNDMVRAICEDIP